MISWWLQWHFVTATGFMHQAPVWARIQKGSAPNTIPQGIFKNWTKRNQNSRLTKGVKVMVRIICYQKAPDWAQVFCLTLCPFHQHLPAPRWVSYDVCQSYVLHGPCGCPRYWWPWQQPASRWFMLKQSSHAFHCWRWPGYLCMCGNVDFTTSKIRMKTKRRSISS